MLREMNSYEDYEVIQTGTGVAKVGATWCGPCKTLDKTLEALAPELAVDIVKVDIDATPIVAVEHGIMGIPVMIVFKDGKVVEKIQGVKSKEELKTIIENALA
jgi:thioredoxin 1